MNSGFIILWLLYVMTLVRYGQPNGLEDFFREVKEGPVDLVVLMDRSSAVGRHSFYTNQKVLMHDIIMYHLPVHPERLRIAIITFAMDSDIILDGISDRNEMTKCDIFNDEDNFYWNDVIYKVKYESLDGELKLNYSVHGHAKVDEALQTARGILASGRSNRAAKQYVLIATAAAWPPQHDPKREIDRLLDDGVIIYVIGTGTGIGSREKRLHELQKNDTRDNVQMENIWRNYVNTQQKLIEVLDVPDWVGSTGHSLCPGGYGYCETITSLTSCTIMPTHGCANNPCRNGGSCFTGDVMFQCLCTPGFFGRHCDKDYDECSSPNVCYPGSRCINMNNDFRCECNSCDDIYCDCYSDPPPDLQQSLSTYGTTEGHSYTDDNDDNDSGTNLTWVYVLVPLLLLLLIALLVIGFCYYERRKRQKQENNVVPSPSLSTRNNTGQENYYEGIAARKETHGTAAVDMLDDLKKV